MADEGNLSLDSSKFFCESNESLARKLGVPADTHPDVLQVLLTDYYEQGGSNSDEEEVPRWRLALRKERAQRHYESVSEKELWRNRELFAGLESRSREDVCSSPIASVVARLPEAYREHVYDTIFPDGGGGESQEDLSRFDADDCSVTVHLFLSAFDKANQQSHFDSQQVADLKQEVRLLYECGVLSDRTNQELDPICAGVDERHMASLGTSSGKKAVVEPGESRVTMLSTDVVNAARMVLDAVHSVPVLPDRKGPGPSLTLEEAKTRWHDQSLPRIQSEEVFMPNMKSDVFFVRNFSTGVTQLLDQISPDDWSQQDPEDVFINACRLTLKEIPSLDEIEHLRKQINSWSLEHKFNREPIQELTNWLDNIRWDIEKLEDAIDTGVMDPQDYEDTLERVLTKHSSVAPSSKERHDPTGLEDSPQFLPPRSYKIDFLTALKASEVQHSASIKDGSPRLLYDEILSLFDAPDSTMGGKPTG